ncbi:hypothetical protein CR513_54430, partial [Mucuna pruriens]
MDNLKDKEDTNKAISHCVFAMLGGATVCSGHRFLCVLPHSTRSRPVPVQLGSISALNGGVKRFSSKLSLVPRAVDSSTAQTSVVPDDGFSVSKISFGVVGLGVGLSLLSYGFGAYFNLFPGSEWSAIMLTYGFPLAIIGMALKYAELKPVPCLTYSDAESLREKCATPILKQVKSDVTRYRYGDEQHLDEALKRIFQYGQGGGIPRRSAPVLQSIREEVTQDGKYCLVLAFEAKALQLSDFEQRQLDRAGSKCWLDKHLVLTRVVMNLVDHPHKGGEGNGPIGIEKPTTPWAKFTSFFGPGISAEIGKGEKDLYEVRLISNTDPNASPS